SEWDVNKMGQRRSQAQLIVGSKWVYVTEKRGKREWVRDKSDSEPMSSQGWNDVVFLGRRFGERRYMCRGGRCTAFFLFCKALYG
ncbi:MAG TPA: hypothetical protein PLM19_05530, partial [Candidatus Syntrophosphaera sp.]|nr:hypothetical protein [Candidatus Syntrophosphaera sp.]